MSAKQTFGNSFGRRTEVQKGSEVRVRATHSAKTKANEPLTGRVE
jgi:hypothetical protein